MCDIYNTKCEVCGKIIGMHLGDYETRREEVKVYCSRHIPPNHKHVGARIMVDFTDYSKIIQMARDYPEHYDSNEEHWVEYEPFIYVESLTDNAWKNRLMNHQNSGFNILVPLKELDMYQYGFEMWVRGQYSMERSR